MLLVNDAHYGGLSDRVTIITNSRTSGTISARHELAHSFGDFGEEYDGALGGEDYSGANFAATTRRCREGEVRSGGNGRLVWQCLNWERWLTPPAGEDRDAWLASTAASSVLLYAEYPWTVLGARAAPWEASFEPPAAGWRGARLQLSWSVAGVVGSGAAFEIELDGQQEWTPGLTTTGSSIRRRSTIEAAARQSRYACGRPCRPSRRTTPPCRRRSAT